MVHEHERADGFTDAVVTAQKRKAAVLAHGGIKEIFRPLGDTIDHPYCSMDFQKSQ
jgi:hypothetical protein